MLENKIVMVTLGVTPFTHVHSTRYGMSTRRKRVPAFPGLFQPEHSDFPECKSTFTVDPKLAYQLMLILKESIRSSSGHLAPFWVGTKKWLLAALKRFLALLFRFWSRASCSIWPSTGAYRSHRFHSLTSDR